MTAMDELSSNKVRVVDDNWLLRIRVDYLVSNTDGYITFQFTHHSESDKTWGCRMPVADLERILKSDA